jgi:hypothetical protein
MPTLKPPFRGGLKETRKQRDMLQKKATSAAGRWTRRESNSRFGNANAAWYHCTTGPNPRRGGEILNPNF